MTDTRTYEIYDTESDTGISLSNDLKENIKDPQWSPTEHRKRSLRNLQSELEASGTQQQGRYNLRPRHYQFHQSSGSTAQIGPWPPLSFRFLNHAIRHPVELL
jgi:hypothetical protein